MNEFDLIEKYFNWYSGLDASGVGDDCAIVSVGTKQHIATTVDTLIEGVHFPKNTSAEDIAYKVLAVNLSDLAAMGATPLYFTLALTLPNIDEQWLEEFSSELKSLAQQYNIRLVGGDTTKGALSITINVTGTVAKSKALLRSGAKLGDEIFVSNTLGDAALAWRQIQAEKTPSKALLAQFNRPKPQIELGQALAGVANSCIDISDGLEQDLSHILSRSNVGAKITLDALPLSADVAKYISKTQDWCIALAGGDDYELCFTVPKSRLDALEVIQDELGINLSKIGVITKSGLNIEELDKNCHAYRHF
ncbi:Thiamine-monophosphate kinase [uncultured Candidatus Thioglobus sp.]|nr:Thiamine-monophosphate kinase [uncultured Candidatus Thioglobus sp.]